MKRIAALDEPTPGLVEYKEVEGDAATWDGFGSHAGTSDAKRELAGALETVQHGLCGYCEASLDPRNRQIEHVVARSDRGRDGPARSLDHSNMIACCLGNTSLQPGLSKGTKGGVSCGQAKDDNPDPQFLDPRQLPALPSVVRVSDDGELSPNHAACQQTGLDPTRVQRTIEILRLNIARLRSARADQLRALQEDLIGYGGDKSLVRAAAKRELLPDESGRLPPYFTTTRSFFREVAEDVLDEPGLPWV